MERLSGERPGAARRARDGCRTANSSLLDVIPSSLGLAVIGVADTPDAAFGVSSRRGVGDVGVQGVARDGRPPAFARRSRPKSAAACPRRALVEFCGSVMSRSAQCAAAL